MQGDLGWIVSHLGLVLARMRRLESDGSLVRGLASTLKAKGGEIEQTINVLAALGDAVPKTLTGTVEPVSQYVDDNKVTALREMGSADERRADK